MPLEERTSARAATTGSTGSFRLMGVPVRLHFTFILLLVFLIFTGLGSNQSGLNHALYLVALFVSVLVHEFAHAAVGLHYSIRTIEIVMFPIGGVSRLQRPPKPSEEFWIAIAGPLTNLLISTSLYAWLYATHQSISAV